MGSLILSAGTASARSEYRDTNSDGITIEQEAQFVKMSTAYQKEISPLVEELHEKKMEYYSHSQRLATSRGGTVSENELSALESISIEIAALKRQIREKKIDFDEEVYEETGIYMTSGLSHWGTNRAMRTGQHGM